MVFRAPRAAPQSRVASERRGSVVGRFCHGCGSIYPLQRRLHSGDPIYGRDHIASPCAYEGYGFEPGEAWWEPAVIVLAPPAEPAATAAAPTAG
ncbi:MAG TPA: hypothetical protein VMT16_09745 [Thermoanaerobaculia bacterium]|nr:hypothetical protein [Thermoanaerobaculia bacterium]